MYFTAIRYLPIVIGAGALLGACAHSPAPPQAPSPSDHSATANKPIRASRIGGEEPHLPPLVRAHHRGNSVSGTYRLCLDGQGRVESVAPIQGIVGADSEVMSALRTWTYEAQKLPFCFNEVLRFEKIE